MTISLKPYDLRFLISKNLMNFCCLVHSVNGIYNILTYRTTCRSQYCGQALYHGHLLYNTEHWSFIRKESWRHNGCFIHCKYLENFHILSKCSTTVCCYYQIFIIHWTFYVLYLISQHSNAGCIGPIKDLNKTVVYFYRSYITCQEYSYEVVGPELKVREFQCVTQILNIMILLVWSKARR